MGERRARDEGKKDINDRGKCVCGGGDRKKVLLQK